jgi:heat shock protein HslJ
MKLVRLAFADASPGVGIVVLAAAVLVGCSGIDTATQNASPPPSLKDSAWTLASLPGTAWQVDAYNNGREAVVSVIAGTQLTLDFLADGGLRGSGGCNHFSGRFTVTDGKLSIGQVASTRMACMQPEGSMAQEAAFLAALQSATRARREADRLELRTASGALAVSARLASPPGR